MDIVLSVILRIKDSDYPFGILWPLCCLSFFDLKILITPFVSCGHCVVCHSSIEGFWLHLWYLVTIVLSVILWFKDSDYSFGILWPLCCLILRLKDSDYPLWYIVTIVLSVILRFKDSDYTFGILWPLCCLSFLDWRILITPLVSFDHCVVCHS